MEILALRPTWRPHALLHTSETRSLDLSCKCCGFNLNRYTTRDRHPSLLSSSLPLGSRVTISLKAALINCRSLVKLSLDILQSLKDNDWDLLFLTETWLSEETNPALTLAIPEGHSIICANRQNGKQGVGVAVIYKSKWTVTSPHYDQIDCIEGLPFCIKLSASISCAGLLMYRPPHSSSSHLPALTDYIIQACTRYANFTVLGNFNLHVEDATCPLSSNFISTLAACNLFQLIALPTYRAVTR